MFVVLASIDKCWRKNCLVSHRCPMESVPVLCFLSAQEHTCTHLSLPFLLPATAAALYWPSPSPTVCLYHSSASHKLCKYISHSSAEKNAQGRFIICIHLFLTGLKCSDARSNLKMFLCYQAVQKHIFFLLHQLPLRLLFNVLQSYEFKSNGGYSANIFTGSIFSKQPWLRPVFSHIKNNIFGVDLVGHFCSSMYASR